MGVPLDLVSDEHLDTRIVRGHDHHLPFCYKSCGDSLDIVLFYSVLVEDDFCFVLCRDRMSSQVEYSLKESSHLVVTRHNVE